MNIYIPLLYSEKVKRPDKRYFLNNILGEDFIILILSFAYPNIQFLGTTVGLFLLQISFWCIYELGYIENDVVGDKFENKAILSYNFKSYQVSFSFWQPWLWSLGLSALGILVLLRTEILADSLSDSVQNGLGLSLPLFYIALLLWFGFLVVSRALFYVYNHVNKQSRIWLYFLLQACRYCGYLILISTGITGLMFSVASILTRSIQYILYRYLGGKSSSWPMEFPRYFYCLLIYILLVVILAINDRDITLIASPQALLISAFCVLRGSKHFYKVYTQFLPVSEDGSNQIS
ncbi:MAG: hypothetical protein AAGE96_10220 [Cyanobacteria bacterium P01_G01_bin.19]